MKLEPLFEMAESASGFLIRFSFGTALIASIALVFLTILALALAAKARCKSEDDNDDSGKRGKSYGSGFTFSSSSTDVALDSEMTEEQINQLIADADEDGNGLLDFDEFCYIMTAQSIERETKKQITRAFCLMDKDKDGKISAADIESERKC